MMFVECIFILAAACPCFLLFNLKGKRHASNRKCPSTCSATQKNIIIIYLNNDVIKVLYPKYIYNDINSGHGMQ